MKLLWKVLNQVLVLEYYRQNALFFFVVVMLVFGFLRGEDHTTLNQFAVHSVDLLLVFILLWLLYALKTFNFLKRQLALPQNAFLHHLRSIKPSQRFILWGLIWFSVFLPAILYGGLFTIAVAIYEKTYLSAISVGFSLLSLWFLGTWCLDIALKNRSVKSRFQFVLPNFSFPKNLNGIFIEYLFRKQAVTLFFGKGFACLMLMAVMRLYPTDDYDIRLLFLGVILAGLGQVNILQHWEGFREERLTFLGNLPISKIKKNIQESVLYSILLIPEIVFLFRYFPAELSYFQILPLFVFMWTLVFFTAGWVKKNQDSEILMKQVFWLGMSLFLLVMFRVPPMILVLGLVVYRLTQQNFLRNRKYV